MKWKYVVPICLMVMLCGVAAGAFAGVGDDLANEASRWVGKQTHFLLGAHGSVPNGYDASGRACVFSCRDKCLSYCGGDGITCRQVNDMWPGRTGGHFDCVGFICIMFEEIGQEYNYVYIKYPPEGVSSIPYEVQPLCDRLRDVGHLTFVANQGDPFSYSWANLSPGDILIFANVIKRDGNYVFAPDPVDGKLLKHSAICVAGSSDSGGPRIVSSRAPMFEPCCGADDSGVKDDPLGVFLSHGKAAIDLNGAPRPDGKVYCDYIKAHGFYGYFPLSPPKHTTALECDEAYYTCDNSGRVCVKLYDTTDGKRPLAGKTISFTWEGQSATGTTNDDGKACVSLSGLSPGSHTVHSSFAGDSSYEGSATDCQVFAPWHTAFTCEIPNPMHCSDPGVLSVVLKDESDRPVAGADISIGISGIVLPAIMHTTDQNGRVSIPWTPCPAEDRTLTATFPGDPTRHLCPTRQDCPITVLCDPTIITDGTKIHTVQYSDPIDLGAELTDDEGNELTGKRIDYTVGTQSGWDYTGPNGQIVCEPDNGTAPRDGYADYRLVIDQPATKCVPIDTLFRFPGDACYCESSIAPPIEITCETATIETHWEELVRCDGTVADGATIKLGAYIVEEADGSYGDITKAGPLCFDIVTYNQQDEEVPVQTLCAPVIAQSNPTSGGAPTRGYAEVTVTLKQGLYWVKVRPQSNCYYCAETVEDCVVVYCDGFVTGGGWITCPDGVKKNFGFNLKYKKNSSTVPQGQLQFVDHATGVKLHSTNWDWLVVDEVNRVAWFQGSGTINHAGCFRFIVKVEDKDEPGHPTDPSDLLFDTFSIRIKPCGGNDFPYPCADPDICPIRDGEYIIENCPLGGGNIQIHKPHSQ